jgi:hypothetical protein
MARMRLRPSARSQWAMPCSGRLVKICTLPKTVAAALRLSPSDTTAYVWMAGPDSPSCTWVPMRRQRHGFTAPSRTTAIKRSHISGSRRRWVFSAASPKRGRQPKPDWRSILHSLLPASATQRRPITRFIYDNASAFVTACARSGCQRAKARIIAVQRLGRKPYHRD